MWSFGNRSIASFLIGLFLIFREQGAPRMSRCGSTGSTGLTQPVNSTYTLLITCVNVSQIVDLQKVALIIICDKPPPLPFFFHFFFSKIACTNKNTQSLDSQLIDLTCVKSDPPIYTGLDLKFKLKSKFKTKQPTLFRARGTKLLNWQTWSNTKRTCNVAETVAQRRLEFILGGESALAPGVIRWAETWCGTTFIRW